MGRSMIILRVVRALGLAFVMAVLAGIIGLILAPVDRETLFSNLFFFISLVVFFIAWMKAERVGFWFSLCFAIEWALLPVAAAINVGQPQADQSEGCAILVGAIIATVFLYITIPIGAVGFILFLLLALLVFRKRKAPAVKSPADETKQP
jgi:hypothetical protein